MGANLARCIKSSEKKPTRGVDIGRNAPILVAMEEVEQGREADEAADVKEVREEPNGGGEAEECQEDYREKFYYLAAEMDNLRKRHQRDREDLLKYGNERIIGDLLGVVDNLERTLQAIEGDEDTKVKNIYTGIEMVRGQFEDVLKNNGLEPIGESVGEKFDPKFHEAISQRKSEDRDDGVIVEEYQRGYMLNGRLLRPSKVIIVKN